MMNDNVSFKSIRIIESYDIDKYEKTKTKRNIYENYKLISLFLFLFLIVLFLLNYYKLSNLNKMNQIKLINNPGNNNMINKKNDIKVCICTPGKKENLYITEFVQYYQKYGVDQIIIYDNNNINDESFEDIIKSYIDKGFVKIINWRGIKKNTGYIIREDCYSKNKNKFDWLIFYDIDEYIHLNNYTNIKAFLNEDKFKECKKINLNWIIHTDNNLLYYDNRTLHEGFPEIEPKVRYNKRIRTVRYKSILRGNNKYNKNSKYKNLISTFIKGCNSDGTESNLIIIFLYSKYREKKRKE